MPSPCGRAWKSDVFTPPRIPQLDVFSRLMSTPIGRFWRADAEDNSVRALKTSDCYKRPIAINVACQVSGVMS